jgi:exosortase D (VPLPA-CTERM-specific)
MHGEEEFATRLVNSTTRNSCRGGMVEMLKDIAMRPINWLKAGAYTCLLAIVYYSSLSHMIFNDWTREDYSYCWFIPLVVLYIIWEKKADLARIPSSPSWQGLVPFCTGILLFWLGELGGEYTALYLSLWFVIIGLVWLHIGWQKMRIMAFSFVVMLAMFPLPELIYSRVTLWAKMLSTHLGVWILHAAGITAYREGNVIDLGFTKLQVVDACSGLRYVVPMMVFSILIAYWFRGHIWKKTALFLLSIPLSIVMNSLRIVLTGILFGVMGSAAAEGFFHGFSGWLVFMAAFPVFLALILLLSKLPPKKQKSRIESAQTYDAGIGKTITIHRSEVSVMKSFLQPQFVASLVVLLLTAGISQGFEFRQKVPVSRPFNQFPMQIGDWKGSSEVMEKEFRDALDFSDYIMANYTDSRGKTVNFYIAYYQDQRKGESLHSPETCLFSSGWTFNQAGDSVVTLADGKTSVVINRALIEKAGARELAYFWFPQRGRNLTKLYQLKLFTFWDALTKQRTDGALVRVLTPVYESEQMQDAEQRLQTFTRNIVPVLEGFIPGKDLR